MGFLHLHSMRFFDSLFLQQGSRNYPFSYVVVSQDKEAKVSVI